MDAGLARARELLAGADRVVFLTGAGVSAESGVPTFRGHQGLWKSCRPQDLATPEAFRADPRLVWEWYGWRRTLVAACAPNPAHRAMAGFCLDRDATLVTQNVDGLHTRALLEAVEGDAPPRTLPLTLHGSLFTVKCTSCDHHAHHDGPVDAASLETLPRCPSCAALLRPGVVWFGESLDPQVLSRAFQAAQEADVCVVVGTSAVVHPAASVPLATLEAGGRVLEVNPEPTPLSGMASAILRAPAGRVVPDLLEDGAG